MLGAAALHELGHLAAALFTGAKIRQFDIELWGGKITYGGVISYRSEVIIALSGTTANLIAFFIAIATTRTDSYSVFFALSNLAYAIINLLPIKTLDGYVALNAFFYAIMTQEKADLVLKGLNSAFVLILCATLCYFVALSGINSSVLFLAVMTLSLLLERN